MNEFIEKNKQLLKIYCVAARIIGWALVFMPGILIALIFSGVWDSMGIGNQEVKMTLLNALPWTIFPGLVALVVAQFIRYVFESQYQPGWMLRNGTKILYLYAVILIGHAVLKHLYFIRLVEGQGHRLDLFLWMVNVLPLLLLTSVKVLILVGLGQILRRVLPVIEESRTLV